MPMAEYLALNAFIAFRDGAVQVSRPASGLDGMLGLSVEASVLTGLPVLGGLVVLEVLGVLLVLGVLVVAGLLTGAGALVVAGVPVVAGLLVWVVVPDVAP